MCLLFYVSFRDISEKLWMFIALGDVFPVLQLGAVISAQATVWGPPSPTCEDFSRSVFCRMETDCNPMELSSMSGFEEDSELNGFEGTDMKDMRLEAEAVVNDVLFAVSNMFVSKSLRCADNVAYINVETREGSRYCLELTEAGLRVVGYAFDQVDDDLQTPYHETVYSLLDSLSPAYREAFGNALLQRLEALKRDGQS
ncbi:GSK3B-interacting protein isoform X1 [Elephas maximus indicus]|uniref:GSK3B-interacting protein isoform X1 n=1 Tax=Elephas maximus indicus TaxID=99487 RepID=UPI002116A2CF|nr:GSK3B-interacting protein isoform X1 [Elephas maximus indicus]